MIVYGEKLVAVMRLSLFGDLFLGPFTSLSTQKLTKATNNRPSLTTSAHNPSQASSEAVILPQSSM